MIIPKEIRSIFGENLRDKSKNQMIIIAGIGIGIIAQDNLTRVLWIATIVATDVYMINGRNQTKIIKSFLEKKGNLKKNMDSNHRCRFNNSRSRCRCISSWHSSRWRGKCKCSISSSRNIFILNSSTISSRIWIIKDICRIQVLCNAMGSLMYRVTVRAVHRFTGKLMFRDQKILGTMII